MAIKSKVKKSKLSSNKERGSNKAIICARVSSESQEDNHSLDAQTHNLNAYCKKNNLEVVKEFRIVESSTRGDRPKFKEMLKFIEDQKEYMHLVCDKVDRLQRSVLDVPRLDKLVQAEKLSLHFLDIGTIDSNSNASQKAFYGIAVVFAEAYANAISDNVKRSIVKKLREGTILGQAPLGYINKERPNKKLEPDAIVELDIPRAKLVKRMFEEYATGLYSMKQILENATKAGLKTLKGKKLSHSTVEGILSQPFYYGKMQSGGELYKHVYEPLITEELFNICADVRHGKTTDKTRIPKEEDDFIYRGLLKCYHCKCVYSPELKKGKYTYMRPTKSQGDCEFCVSTNENIINDQMEQVIKELTLPQDMLQQIQPELKKMLEENRSVKKIKYDELNKALLNIKKRQEDVTDQFINQVEGKSITLDEVNEMNKILRGKEIQIQEELASISTDDLSFRNAVITIFELADNLYEIFKSSDNIKKRELIKILCPNLELDGLNLCYSLQKPFDLLQKKEGQPVWLPE
jgi:site-specific DNA recombinase